MTYQYLYPVRKRLELLAALYAGGFGLFVWAMSIHGEPLAWTGLDRAGAMTFGQIMGLAALIHALGVRINGYWSMSPILRFGGMMVHTVLLGFLAYAGIGTTGVYTYGWGCALLCCGTWSAWKDTVRAWGQEWMLN